MTCSASTEGPGLGKRKLVAWAAIILTLLVCVFLPEVASVGWHLIHGNFARFREWEVPVPWGWRSFTAEDTLIVQRMHRFYFRRGAFSQVVVAPSILPPNYIFKSEQWKRALIRNQVMKGFHFISERKIRLDDKDGFCLTFAAAQNAQRLWVACDIPELHLSVDFNGDQTYASALDSIIERIRRANSVKTGQGHDYQHDAKVWVAESRIQGAFNLPGSSPMREAEALYLYGVYGMGGGGGTWLGEPPRDN